jgi:hypothetical protein
MQLYAVLRIRKLMRVLQMRLRNIFCIVSSLKHHAVYRYTDKKLNKIQMGLVAKSYMTKALLIYG